MNQPDLTEALIRAAKEKFAAEHPPVAVADPERRERYAAALYATLEASPTRHPWNGLHAFRCRVWYVRADAAMRLADEERAAVSPPADRADLRDRIAEAIATDDGHPWGTLCRDTQQHYLDNADAVLAVLPAPTDQTAAWMAAAAECDKAGGAYAERGANDAAGAAFALMEHFLRKAGEAEYVATPCSAPDVCEDGGEPCSTHERLMAHAEGDHELCAPDCGEPWLRRLAGEAQQDPTQDSTQPKTSCDCPPTHAGLELCPACPGLAEGEQQGRPE